jgi:hypothetical protein
MFVSSFVSFILFFLTLLLSFLGLLIGAIALFKAVRSPATHGGKAIAATGLILSLLAGAIALSVFGYRMFSSRPTRPSYTYSPNTNAPVTPSAPTTVNYNPFTGSLLSIIPRQIGQYTLTRDPETHRVYAGGPTENVSAAYSAPDGTGAILELKNYPSAQAANQALQEAARTTGQVWGRPLSVTPGIAVKRGQTVGPMIVAAYNDGMGRPVDIVYWADGSLLCQARVYRRGAGRAFYDSVPF